MTPHLKAAAVALLLQAAPLAFLVLTISGLGAVGQELSNQKFFEPAGESVAWELILFLAGLCLVAFL